MGVILIASSVLSRGNNQAAYCGSDGVLSAWT